MTFGIRDRESGNVIACNIHNYMQAKITLEEFERSDREDGVYEEDFYEIYNECSEVEDYLYRNLMQRWIKFGRGKFNYLEAMGCCVDYLNKSDINTSGISFAEANRIIHDVCNAMSDYVEMRRELS